MSKKKKRRSTPQSRRKSPGAEAAEKAAPSPEPAPARPLWRAVLDEPVAIGIACFLFVRPWRDGLTFPAFNAYYAAFVLVLAALWGTRSFLRKEPLRFGVPVALLAAYLAVAYFTGRNTIQYDLTHRGIQNLGIYLLLFLISCNALRTRLAVGIVLGTLVATTLFNGAWAIVHYYETLPAMRAILGGNSNLLLQFFGTSEITLELKHRLESNRAFGTFLFPNALAAFLILGIPYFFAELFSSWRLWREGRLPLGSGEIADSPRAKYLRAWIALAVAGVIGLLTSIGPFLLNDLLGGMNMQDSRPIESIGIQIALFGFLPATLAVASGILVRRRGLLSFGIVLRYIGLSAALLTALFALWLSYSRGGTLGLALASALSIALCFLGSRRNRGIPIAARASVALFLVALSSWQLVSGGVWAQEVADPGLRASPLSVYQTRRGAEIEEMRTLDIEGGGRSLENLTNLNSLGLRLTYWQVALLMVKDHPFTGVGLGNFKTAYPSHQFLGAGDVDTAHNDYLQSYSETGLLGGSLFLAFWVYFAVWGGRRIVREPDTTHRIVLAGLYTGVLGFLLHSLLDFNFVNPSLAAMIYVLAGTFYARAKLVEAKQETEADGRAWPGRLVAASALVLVAVLTGTILRTFLFDFALTEGETGHRIWNVGDRRSFQRHIDVAQFFLRDLKVEESKAKRPQYTAFRDAHLLIPDQALLESFGAIGVPVPGDIRRLRPDEAIPSNAILFITDAARARNAGIAAAEKRVEDLKQWDSFYPHDPELSAHIFGWYDMLFANTDDIAEKKRYVRLALDWSRACVERSPEAPWFRLFYAKALQLRGSIETGQSSIEYYYKGIEEYKRARDLFPISPMFWAHYGQAMLKLGRAFEKAGRTTEGEDLVTQGKDAIKKSDRLIRYKRLLLQVHRRPGEDGSLNSARATSADALAQGLETVL